MQMVALFNVCKTFCYIIVPIFRYILNRAVVGAAMYPHHLPKVTVSSLG